MVSYPIERAVTDSAEFAGRTAAVNMVEVRARLSGYLDQINFKEGALVKKGDVLFVIDQRPYVAELNRSKSQLNQAEASLAESKAKLDEAKAQQNRAIAGYDYAQHHIERSKTLVAGNVVTQEEMELEKSELLQAQADVERAKAQIASSQAAINTAQAAVEAAHANLAVAELNLTYTKVIAPIDGRISRELVTEGNLVQAGLDGGGMLLTTIVSIDPVYANFDVDEGTVLKLQRLNREGKGDSLHDGRFPVQLGLANEDGFPHTGVLNFVDNQINPGTGTLRLRGVFANRDESLRLDSSHGSACQSASRTKHC